MLRDIGTWILILTAVLIFERLWFNMVEWLLSKVKSLLGLNRSHRNWHTFEEETDEER
ncbi:hypothetical protein COLINT_02739 [Collinsella intestinalis DSM 13280]|uniref:Uncharacterized protein n=1 Tax=Collinsella intestinalis DSM 13280 TaxID=521003 RepID=C4F9K5_9ACTN|nr:hypothetical protein COLINT_02739 [Collinsella intestinalis DSM 13280]